MVYPQWQENFLVSFNETETVELRIFIDEEDNSADIERKLGEALETWVSEVEEEHRIVVRDWQVLQILD